MATWPSQNVEVADPAVVRHEMHAGLEDGPAVSVSGRDSLDGAHDVSAGQGE